MPQPVTPSGSGRPSRTNPVFGSAAPHGPGQAKAWLWRCLAILVLLGLPWCAHAKPEAESSAHVDEVVTTIYEFDTLAIMVRQAHLQRIRSQLHMTVNQVSREQSIETRRALHAELMKLTGDIIEKEEWLLGHGAERKAQIHARFLALPAKDQAAITQCVAAAGRFDLQEPDLVQARRHPPASEQGAADRYTLTQKYAVKLNAIDQSTCFSPERGAPMTRLLVPGADEQLSQVGEVIRKALDLSEEFMIRLKSLPR